MNDTAMINLSAMGMDSSNDTIFFSQRFRSCNLVHRFGYDSKKPDRLLSLGRVILALTLPSLLGCNVPVSHENHSVKQISSAFQQETNLLAHSRIAFDKIISGQTSTLDLHQLGFDPIRSTNIQVLNWQEVVDHFNYDLKHPKNQEIFDPGIRYCIRSQKHCQGYKITIKEADHVDVKTTLSPVKTPPAAIILIKNDLIVFKQWNGQPDAQISKQPSFEINDKSKQKKLSESSKQSMIDTKEQNNHKNPSEFNPKSASKTNKNKHGVSPVSIPAQALTVTPNLQKEILDWN
ncbi:MAG: hypothetical protein H7833_06650 [Magnetococcus sp. DMHC-1]|nr:hypothetical protein [Magnetococcales bacterium]